MLDRDRALGALLGAAVGDALGMPVDGLSHQNVRLYYKGIKGYRDDEKRGDLRAGQWTAHTQRQSVLTHFLAASPRPSDLDLEDLPGFFPFGAHQGPLQIFSAMAGGLRRSDPPYRALGFRRALTFPAPSAALAAAIAPLGVWAAAAHGISDEALSRAVHDLLEAGDVHPLAVVAATGQARAVIRALAMVSEEGGIGFLGHAVEAARVAEMMNETDDGISRRLHALAAHLDETPLDLQDRCNGTGAAADEAFPFAVAMFARNPALVEATLLSAVNVGGAASAVGAMTGALLGAFNGWSAFPAEWREGLEDVGRLEAGATALLEKLEVGSGK